MIYEYLITSDQQRIPIKSNKAKQIIKQYLLYLKGGSDIRREVRIKKFARYLEETDSDALFKSIYDYSVDKESDEELTIIVNEQLAAKRDIIRYKSIFEYDGNQRFIIIGDSNHGNNFQTTIELLIDLNILSKDVLANTTIFSEKISDYLKNLNIESCRLIELDNNTYTTGEDFGLSMEEFFDMRCFYSNIWWTNFIKNNAGEGVNIICVGTDHIRDTEEKNLDGTPLFALPLQIHLNNFMGIEAEVMTIGIDENINEDSIEIHQNKLPKLIPKLLNFNSTEVIMNI